MPLAVESDEASNPVDVCLLRPEAVVPEANRLSDLVEQAGRRGRLHDRSF